MNVLVYDVAASESGALTVLNNFYRYAKNYPDKEVHWFFVVSLPELEDTEHITVLKYPWVKKSWFHRLGFDYIAAGRLIKKYKIDEVLSLQNIAVPGYRKPQILYVHTSLPFVEYRFSFRESKISWIYQNILGRRILASIRKAKTVIVQTEWMREACSRMADVSEDKFRVSLPQVEEALIIKFEDTKENRRRFFFPANPYEYKNHKVILNACKILKEDGITGYEVIFSFCGEESAYAESLREEVQREGLPIEFHGAFSQQEVFSLYAKSILVFPSYVETVGLPLLEARKAETFILASEEAFSKEILKDYEKACFFDKNDAKKLSQYMKELMRESQF